MTNIDEKYNHVLEIIEKKLIPDEEAKKERGEVFTKLSLVREMILGIKKSSIEKGRIEIWGMDKEQFIEDDEEDRVGGVPLQILRDADMKWFDPANGIGNFPVVIFYILDYQLGHYGKKEWIGDIHKSKRQKHIIEKMLYMVEINKGNVNTCVKIFKLISSESIPNICCADTMKLTDDSLLRLFGVNRFDIVIGNPPFNTGGTKHHGDRGYYTRFIEYGFNILNKHGFLVFVNPPNYHRIEKDNPTKSVVFKELFNNNNLIFLRIISDTKLYFNVQILIDYYILQKGMNQKNATVLDKQNVLSEKFDISKFKIVPNYGFNVIQKLEILRESLGRFKAKYGRGSETHAARKGLFKNGSYPILHTITEKGIKIKISNKKHTYQDTVKVIINGLGVPYVFEDRVFDENSELYHGKYGVTQLAIYVLRPTNKERIFLFSKLFQYLIWAYRIQGNNNDMFFFEILPDLNKLDFKDEKTMLESFDFSDKEIKKIMTYTIPIFEKIEISDSKKPTTNETKSNRKKTKHKTQKKQVNLIHR
jgi:hypothetical protein